MSRESESEQSQRTVAELLAQYGAGAGEVTPRRRRRRAEDASDTAPQAIIDRVNSDSGRLLPIRDEEPPTPPLPQSAPPRPLPPEPERTVYQQPVRPEPPAVRPDVPLGRAEPRVDPPGPRPDAPPARPEPVRGEPPHSPPTARLDPALGTRADPLSRLDPPVPDARRRGAPPAPSPAEETRQVPPIVDDYAADGYDDYDYAGEPSRPNHPEPDLTQTLAPPPGVVKPGPPAPPPPADASRANLVRPAPPGAPPVREPVTEQLPRISDKLTPNVPLESLPTESVLIVPPAPPALPEPLPDQTAEDWFGDDEEGERAPEPESTQFHPYVDLDDDDEEDGLPRRDPDDDEEPAGLADVEPDEPGDRSPGKEWLAMIGQLAIGVLGGAALWLGFSFLWRTLAPAALVVALAVTVGLVMLVRKIRRADDLQTTILAVLVGLIVTVSPAAMLLVKS
ncbi:hypothetical protein [Saccharothrix australiensis]|uniref:Uncharacterized protein n=1 Tax=Saccharothrix australiensis TaxID=2072 RepID=A0A495W834_9PSEU|nr:hypothetical protein [Saccharothrix australiensis]RKT57921.1 hypothetical protein C8E97_6653 [Saccharothrix australiensis]